MSNLIPPTDGLVDVLRTYHHAPMGEARALPLDLYTSEPLIELETDRIFRREWICVGRTDQVGDVERGLLNEGEEALVHLYRHLAGQLDSGSDEVSSSTTVSLAATGASR